MSVDSPAAMGTRATPPTTASAPTATAHQHQFPPRPSSALAFTSTASPPSHSPSFSPLAIPAHVRRISAAGPRSRSRQGSVSSVAGGGGSDSHTPPQRRGDSLGGGGGSGSGTPTIRIRTTQGHSRLGSIMGELRLDDIPTSPAPPPDPAPFSPTTGRPRTAAFVRARRRWYRAVERVLNGELTVTDGAEGMNVSCIGGAVFRAQKVAFLRSHHLLSRLPVEKQQSLVHLLRRVVVPKGTTLFKQGDPATHVYFLLDGACTVEASVPLPVDPSNAATAAASTTEMPSALAAAAAPPAPPQNPLIDTHVQRTLDGWFAPKAPTSPPPVAATVSAFAAPTVAVAPVTPATKCITVSLFHLAAPDLVGAESEAKRDSTVTAASDVTAYVLRRVSLRAALRSGRGVVQRLLTRALQLKQVVVRTRVQHALRMHAERTITFGRVHSRLELSQFAKRALDRTHNLRAIKAAADREARALAMVTQQQEAEDARHSRHSYLAPSPPPAASNIAPVSASSSLRPMSARPASSSSSLVPPQPPRFVPTKSVAEREEHHRSLLRAQASLESARANQRLSMSREKQRRVELQSSSQQYKFGFHKFKLSTSATKPGKSLHHERRKGGRRTLNAAGEWISSTGTIDSQSDSDSGISDSDDADVVAASVWHAFPHAYAEAQWHVYHGDEVDGGDEIDPHAEDHEANSDRPTYQSLMHAHTARIERELAKTDAKTFHQVISSPYKNGRPTRKPSISVPMMQTLIPPRPGTAPSVPSAPAHRRNMSSRVMRSWPKPAPPVAPLPISASFVGVQPQPSNKKQSTFASRGSRLKAASSTSAAATEDAKEEESILSADPFALPIHSTASTPLGLASHVPLLSFFSAQLLRHLDNHYLRATDVAPISYTGRWLFFHAPVLPDQMPAKRRVRKPKNWAPFSIPDERVKKQLEKRLHAALQRAPLDVPYAPPPPPLTSLLTSPRAGQEVPLVEAGGNANSEDHWRHLSPTVLPTRAPVRSTSGGSPTLERSHSGVVVSSSPAAPASGAATPHSPFLQLPLFEAAMEELSLGVGVSSSPARTRPSSAARARHGHGHPRHPSLDAVERAYTFRVGHSDAERGVTSPGGAANTDWQFERLKRGRLDTRAKEGEWSPTIGAQTPVVVEPEDATQAQVATVRRNASKRASCPVVMPPASSPSSSHRGLKGGSKRASGRVVSVTASAVHAMPMTPSSSVAAATPGAFLWVSGQTVCAESAVPVVEYQPRDRSPTTRELFLLGAAAAIEAELRSFDKADQHQSDEPAIEPSPAATPEPAVSSPSAPWTVSGSNPSAHAPRIQLASTPTFTRPSSAPARRKLNPRAERLSIHVQEVTGGEISAASVVESASYQPVAISYSAIREMIEEKEANDLVTSVRLGAQSHSIPLQPSVRPRTAFTRGGSLESRAYERGGGEALLASFDPRRVEVRTVRRSLADSPAFARPAAGPPSSSSGTGDARPLQPQPPLHPYPPKHAASASLAAGYSHAYVYGARQAHASDALSLLSGMTAPGTSTATGTPHRHVALCSASARAQALLAQLQQFGVGRAQRMTRPVKAVPVFRAHEDFAHINRARV